MMPGALRLRTACLSAMAVWRGGFPFDAEVVVPIPHDASGSIGDPAVTRRTTVALDPIAPGTPARRRAWVLAVRLPRSRRAVEGRAVVAACGGRSRAAVPGPDAEDSTDE